MKHTSNSRALHSDRSKNLEPAFYIFSAQKGIKTGVDIINANKAEIAMRSNGVPFKVVRGCFNGVEEVSYIVPAQHREFVFEQAELFNQDAVLYVDQFRQAYLASIVGEKPVYPLGKYKRIGNVKPLEGAWTLDSVTGEYWQAV